MIQLSYHRNIFTRHLLAGAVMMLLWGLNSDMLQGQSMRSQDMALNSQGPSIQSQDKSAQSQSQALQSKAPPALSSRSRLSSVNSTCSNYISISGETNINMFSLDQYVPEDLICGTGDSRWIQLPEQEVYLIRIPVRNFEASNRIVYKDFLEMIEVQQHPFINIFMNESEFEMLFQDLHFFLPRIGISVAGTTRYYEIPCHVSDCVDGKISVTGRKTLKLTDFKLAPPVKTMGLIRVQNELIINFEFSLPSDPGIKLSKI